MPNIKCTQFVLLVWLVVAIMLQHFCTHMYALEEFVQLVLREDGKYLAQAVCSNGTDLGAEMFHQGDVATVKEQYGKQKRRKLVQPLYDPCPLNLRLPKLKNRKHCCWYCREKMKIN